MISMQHCKWKNCEKSRRNMTRTCAFDRVTLSKTLRQEDEEKNEFRDSFSKLNVVMCKWSII